MNPIGAPIEIQNTDGQHWLVTCNHAVSSETESVSFTAAIPRSLKTLGAIQLEAVQRAVEMLKVLEKNLMAAEGSAPPAR